MNRSYLKRALSVLIVLSVLVVPVSADYLAVGTVDASNLRLRSEPSTSAKTLATAKSGDLITVLHEECITNSYGDWYSVVYNGIKGYMSADYIKVTYEEDFTVGTGILSDGPVNFRKEPNTDCGTYGKIAKGTSVSVVGIENGWYKVTYKNNTGYIHPDYISITSQGTVSSTSVNNGSSNNSAANKTGVYGMYPTTSAKDLEVGMAALNKMDPTAEERAVVEYALSFLGCKYVWGTANGKTFDCSGFTSYVYKNSGISISRTAVDQYSAAKGTKVDKSDLRPGDLVFFKDSNVSKKVVTHVGIYIGDGLFVHAGSGSSGSGKCVKVGDITGSYYYKVYHSGKRIL